MTNEIAETVEGRTQGKRRGRTGTEQQPDSASGGIEVSATDIEGALPQEEARESEPDAEQESGGMPAHLSAGHGAMSASAAPPLGREHGEYDAYGAYDGYGDDEGGRMGYRGNGWNGGRGRRGGYDGDFGGAGRKTPSPHQVREITARGMSVPPSHQLAQELLDSFEPSEPQQRRLNELGLTAATRGEAKQVIADYVAEHPEILQEWEAQNAQAAVERRQGRQQEQEPRTISSGLFQLLASAGVTNIPTDHATASALADALPPSGQMARVLRAHGRDVPKTRGEARVIISGLPATPDQVQAIVQATGGWYPKTRGEADRWFRDNPRPQGNRGGYGRGGNRGGYGRGYGRGYERGYDQEYGRAA